MTGALAPGVVSSYTGGGDDVIRSVDDVIQLSSSI